MNLQRIISIGDRVIYIDFRQGTYNPVPIGTVTDIVYYHDRYFYMIDWDHIAYHISNGSTYADFQIAKMIMPGDNVDESFIQGEKDDDINAADWWKA